MPANPPLQAREMEGATDATLTAISSRTGNAVTCSLSGVETIQRGNSISKVSEDTVVELPQEELMTVRTSSNVANQQRRRMAVKTKREFQDVLKAHEGCNIANIDISDYFDDLNVNGILPCNSLEA